MNILEKLSDWREKGVALMELSFALPVLLILTMGVAGFGMTLRKMQVLSAAVKHGARAASIYQLSSGPCCGAVPTTLANCPGPNINIQSVAWCSINTFLQDANLDPLQWDVIPSVEENNEGGLPVLTVHVSIKANAKTECVLCGNKFVEIPINIGAQSSFALQNTCTFNAVLCMPPTP